MTHIVRWLMIVVMHTYIHVLGPCMFQIYQMSCIGHRVWHPNRWICRIVWSITFVLLARYPHVVECLLHYSCVWSWINTTSTTRTLLCAVSMHIHMLLSMGVAIELCDWFALYVRFDRGQLKNALCILFPRLICFTRCSSPWQMAVCTALSFHDFIVVHLCIST